MPLEAGDVTRPGTAATVRPSASAIRAHASSPGRSCASTTTVSPASLAMIRSLAARVERDLGEAKGYWRGLVDTRARRTAGAADEFLRNVVYRGADRPADAGAERSQCDSQLLGRSAREVMRRFVAHTFRHHLARAAP